MHPAFATVTFQLRDLAAEHETFVAAEQSNLKDLAAGDMVARWVAKTARASAVESLFTGMEAILKTILGVLNEQVYQTKGKNEQHQFHTQLIAQAALGTDTRPPLISNDLRLKLDQLRKFRHVERNTYGHSLDGERVEDVVATAFDTSRQFQLEITDFLSAMSVKPPS